MIEHDAPDAYVMDECSEEAIEYIYYNIIGSIPDFNNKYPVILFKKE